MKRQSFALGVAVGLMIALLVLALMIAVIGVEASPDSWSARLIRGGDVAHWSNLTPGGGQADYSARIVGATLWLWQGHDALPNATLEVIHFPGGRAQLPGRRFQAAGVLFGGWAGVRDCRRGDKRRP